MPFLAEQPYALSLTGYVCPGAKGTDRFVSFIGGKVHGYFDPVGSPWEWASTQPINPKHHGRFWGEGEGRGGRPHVLISA